MGVGEVNLEVVEMQAHIRAHLGFIFGTPLASPRGQAFQKATGCAVSFWQGFTAVIPYTQVRPWRAYVRCHSLQKIGRDQARFWRLGLAVSSLVLGQSCPAYFCKVWHRRSISRSAVVGCRWLGAVGWHKIKDG